MKIDPQTLRSVATLLSVAAEQVKALNVTEMSQKMIGDVKLSTAMGEFDAAWRQEQGTLGSSMASVAQGLAQAADNLARADSDVQLAFTQKLGPVLGPQQGLGPVFGPQDDRPWQVLHR